MKHTLTYEEYIVNESIISEFKNNFSDTINHIKKLAQEEINYNKEKKIKLIQNSDLLKKININDIKKIDKINYNKVDESFFSSITKQTGLIALVFGSTRYINPILNFLQNTKEYINSLFNTKSSIIQSINLNLNVNFVENGFFSEILFDVFLIFTIVFLVFLVIDIIKK